MAETSAQLTTLLPNDVLTRVERLRIHPLRRRTNHSRGEHLAGRGGTSTEFADYRDYVAGDDLRYVDWNIFARVNHPYLKLFKHEEELHVVLLLDASRSMQFEGKFQLACRIAAALGVMALMGGERVSVYACRQPGQDPVVLPPCRGRTSLKRMLQFLEGLTPGADVPIETAVGEALRRHRGKGVGVVLSDFLTVGELARPFNMLHAAGLEVYAVQILGPTELDPELAGDLRLVDAETGQTLDVSSIGELLGLYHEHRRRLAERLTDLCRQRQGRFLSLSAAEEIQSVLFDHLLLKGWIR
jgi:uncharacterized protein (DUF58 family)